jgi:Putative adhesin
MDVPGIPRPVLLALIALAVLLLAAGGSWALSWATRQTDTNTRTLGAAPTIAIDSHRSGDVEVVGTDRSDIRLITEEHRSVFGRPHVGVRYSGGNLRLDGHCSEFEVWGSDAACGVHFRLEVPRDTTVRLAANSGDVRAEDLSGAADLRTRSGDVHAVDIVGALRLQTISGDVHADASSADIEAITTSGDVHVHARSPTHVIARTTSGDVHVSVPDRTYAVKTRVVSGDDHVDVRRDDRAPRSIDASTTSGDVHVSPDG